MNRSLARQAGIGEGGTYHICWSQNRNFCSELAVITVSIYSPLITETKLKVPVLLESVPLFTKKKNHKVSVPAFTGAWSYHFLLMLISLLRKKVIQLNSRNDASRVEHHLHFHIRTPASMICNKWV